VPRRRWDGKLNNFRAFDRMPADVLELLPARVSPRRGRCLVAVVALALLAVAGCRGGGRIVLPVTLEESAPALHYPTDFGSHAAVVRGVATILSRDLGLAVPEHVTVYIYSSRAVFEQGLISDGRLPLVRAAELSEFAVGVGKRRQLLLQDSGGPPAGREWIRLIAHELTHVAQIELAQGEGRAEQWLAEGMAEWAAFRVLERLGVDSLVERRAAAMGHVRGHPALRGRRLDLDQLGTSRGFTVRHLRDGSLATYQLAFLMTDYLIRRQGFDGLLGYFHELAAGRGRYESFRIAFGQTLPQFEQEVLEHFGQVLR
jgi:hypothetical protein